MQKPNFKDLKKLSKAIFDMDSAFSKMYSDKNPQTAEIVNICRHIAADKAKENLFAISTEEIRNAKAGIRVPALMEAGYTDFGKIAGATDIELMSIDGIGEKQVEAIRNIVTEFANSLSSKVSIRLDAEDNSSDNQTLITALARFRYCEQVRAAALKPSTSLYNFVKRIRETKIIGNDLHWLFSTGATKQQTLSLAGDMYAFYDSPLFETLVRFLDRYHEAATMAPGEAIKEFNKNSADFYALLESMGAATGNKPFLYDSIPAGLASEIDGSGLDLTHFNGNLRAYQAFGAKYILHQKKVLLGDEMGLGKTIQAIAAMSHIHASGGTNSDNQRPMDNAQAAPDSPKKCFFLVICPASVLINWAREIRKFSDITPYILHGQTMEDAFNKWQETGGAAITNYESMGKIVDRIDNHMHLSMLVVDEAHYMKNPDAKRTMYIRRLDNESERILMMTGTPLENRVEEMCNLIDFVRPDMTKDVRALAHISNLPEFKETLSPVYLRRTRQQVLQELPPIDSREEWCQLSDSDKEAYTAAVMGGNFADMRRVSFLQADLTASAKAIRLRELCDEARDESRKIVIYSFFRDTISKVSALLGDRCIGVITGETAIEKRQPLVDKFGASPDGSVLVCQIQAGGVGLNIQSASIVIFCEPQIKPSLTMQALSRVYRMGQVKNVLVYHLLCPDTVDERMMDILGEKQFQFDSFADESAIADAYENKMDSDWIRKVIEEEQVLIKK